MQSMERELAAHRGQEVAAWMSHADLKVLAGRLTKVESDHFVILAGEHTYYIPYHAITAIRPSRPPGA
jgi:ribosome maturation factor RimP